MSRFEPLDPPDGYVYTPCPDAARYIARRILHNTQEPIPEGLPPEWIHVAVAVADVSDSATWRTRQEAFINATRGFDYGMVEEVFAFMPDIEDPADKARIFYSADDALHDPPALAWCVEGLFTQPSLNLLVGPPGVKKTYLAIDLAVAVATGQPWLDRPVAQAPVVYVDEETGLSRLWGRFNAALRGRNAGYGVPLNFVSLGGYDLRLPNDFDQLMQRCLSYEAQFIVVDTLAGVLRGGDENSVLAVQPLLYNLHRLAEHCRAAVLLIHHTNREGAFRGSSSIMAAVDLMLGIQSASDSPLIQLETLKARHAAPPAFNAHAHFETDPASGAPLFHLTATDQTPAEAEETKPVKLNNASVSILKRMDKIGCTSTNDLMANLELAPTTIRQTIQELMGGEYINRSNEGSRGKQAFYELTPKGQDYVDCQED